jgi:hypothetical protein
MEPVPPIDHGHARPNGWDSAVYAKDQPEYIPLPVIKSAQGHVVSRWKLTWRERMAVLFGRHLWVTMLTFNQPLQPIKLDIGRPDNLE